MNVLEFPALGIKLNLNPVAFSIGDFSVAWYGIIIAAGFLLALWYGLRNAKKYGVNPDKMIDVVIGGIIGGIVGARLYYVIFSWSDYKDDLLKIFRIWEGGLAIYGGLIVAKGQVYGDARPGRAGLPDRPGHRTLGELYQH